MEVILTFLLYFGLIQNGWTDGSRYFVLEPNITGKTCSDSRIVTYKAVTSLSSCAYKCQRMEDCESFFYSSSSRRCDGCTVIYETDASLTEDMQDSVYYHDRCPTEWASNGYPCYLFNQSEGIWHTYDQAKAKCEGMSSHLVQIETEKEQLFLMEYLDAMYRLEYGYVHYWLGLSKRTSVNGAYVWETTQAEPTYTNFGVNQIYPGAPCVWMAHLMNFTWWTDGCNKDWALYLLCEM